MSKQTRRAAAVGTAIVEMLDGQPARRAHGRTELADNPSRSARAMPPLLRKTHDANLHHGKE
jgi:hypothetical protein